MSMEKELSITQKLTVHLILYAVRFLSGYSVSEDAKKHLDEMRALIK